MILSVSLCTQSLSHVQLLATSRTVACQASLSMGFSRQEYWSGLPFPSLGDLPHPGIEPRSPALQPASLPSEPPRKPHLQLKKRFSVYTSIAAHLGRKHDIIHWVLVTFSIFHSSTFSSSLTLSISLIYICMKEVSSERQKQHGTSIFYCIFPFKCACSGPY